MIKHITKRSSAILLVLCLLLACGCSPATGNTDISSASGAKEAEAPALGDAEIILDGIAVDEYVRYDYSLLADFFTSEQTGTLWRNITMTSGSYEDMWPAAGVDLFTCSSSLESALRVIEAQIQRGRNESEAVNALTFTETYRGCRDTFDNAFFNSHHLLLIDLSNRLAVGEVISKVRAETNGSDTITLTVYFGGVTNLTGGSSGVLYLIPVPASCHHIDVDWVWVHEWDPYYGQDTGNS